MDFPSRTFADFLRDMAAAVQGLSGRVMDFSPGSVLRSLLEANAAVAMWIQWLMLAILQTTRAATSEGADLDSWMRDFGVSRLPAIASTGHISVSRLVDTDRTVVPKGMIVKTTNGDKAFVVTEDANNPVWSAVDAGYILAPGVLTISVPVECLESGSAGNIQTGTITLVASPAPGVDRVYNGAAFQIGLDAEDDNALRIRFQDYLSSRSRATRTAISYAISELRQGIRFAIEENCDAAGETRPGNFVVIVDDGSGWPSAQLLDRISAAIDLVRPVGSTFSVIRATVVAANINLTLDLNSGHGATNVHARVTDAIASFVNSLRIGGSLSLTRVAEIAYRTDENIVNARSVSINGVGLDLASTTRTVIKAGAVRVV